MWSRFIHIFRSFETCSCVILYCAAFVCRQFPMMKCKFLPLLSQSLVACRILKRENCHPQMPTTGLCLHKVSKMDRIVNGKIFGFFFFRFNLIWGFRWMLEMKHLFCTLLAEILFQWTLKCSINTCCTMLLLPWKWNEFSPVNFIPNVSALSEDDHC